jgi:hypothetical protein
MDDKQDMFDFLTALRDSGTTNMMFAPSYLMTHYDLSKRDAMQVFTDWCESLRSKA